MIGEESDDPAQLHKMPGITEAPRAGTDGSSHRAIGVFDAPSIFDRAITAGIAGSHSLCSAALLARVQYNIHLNKISKVVT